MKNAILFRNFILTLLCAVGFNSSAQIVGADAFIMAPTIEVGVHARGFEGSSILPPFPNHARFPGGRLGFVANPFDDGWVEYDGDFYLPGSPENTFGIQIAGVDHQNSATGEYDIPITTGLHDYAVIGRCKFVEWEGAIDGVNINMRYKMDTTTTYYIVDVTLTNTTAAAKNNVYFYKTFDPDNNQTIGWSFVTTNTIESQASPFCPKSLVSATQSNTWDNYVGLGAIDPNTRVSKGGFAVPSGSDIWNGVGGLTGTEGSVSTFDEAISISHRDAVLPAGGTSNFQFVVILDAAQVEEAIQSLYFVDFDGGAGAEAACTALFADIDGDGDDDPLPDTLLKDCSTGPLTLALDGPYLGLGYEITWTNMDTGEDIGTGAEITVSPSGTTLYRVVADPLGDCFELPIERFLVVEATGDAPDVEITDPGPQCGSFDISTLTIEDLEGLPGSIMGFFTEAPDSIDDPTDTLATTIIYPGDDVYVMIGIPETGCFDYEPIEITFIEINAGEDSTGFEMCNAAAVPANMSTFLVDADPGGTWSEDPGNPTVGGLDPATEIFDPAGVLPGDYTIYYILDGGAVCDDDTATMTISVYDQPDAGEDGAAPICNTPGFSINLNTLLVGADPGGIWSEVTVTGGAFNPASGLLSMDGSLAAGDYTFEYTLAATDPCVEDVATFVITVNPLPVVNAGPDQSICIGTETFVAASGTPGVSYAWDPAAISDGIPFTPVLGTITYTVTGTDANGCVNTDNMDIEVNPLPVISFSASDTAGCTPFNVDFTVVSDQTIATTDWIFGDGDVASVSTSPYVSHTYLSEGLNTVSATVTDVKGCSTSITYTDYITVEEMPIAAFTFAPQAVYTTDTEVNFTNESLHATDYLWDFADGSANTTEENPTHEFPTDVADIFYPVQLSASNYLGCTDITTGYLNVRGIILFYVPNTFTPDGDQYNDIFQPVFESGFDPYNYHMTVFNRWGEIVFESYDATVGWDGTYGGSRIIKDGVYTWTIEFKEAFSDARHFESGTVNIMR